MAVIELRGYFDFSCSTPTYRTIECFFKSGQPAKANFNKLQITYIGTVRVFIENEGKFVCLSQILPKYEKDEEYFIFISKEINLISQKRKKELKHLQKTKKAA